MNLNQSMRRFFSGTLLSRISGMGRDLAMAFAFGDHPSVAAFLVAFRFSNLFRRLLGEGPFQSVFIPHYQGLHAEDPEKAARFYRQLSFFLSLLLVTLIGVSEVGLTLLQNWGRFSSGNQEILSLTAWMLPGLLFICLYGLNLSLLNCHDSFFLPSFAPFVCNVIWIGGALWLRQTPPESAMLVLSKILILAYAAQWLMTLPSALKQVSFHWKECLSFSIAPEIRKLAQSFGFGIIGVSAVQINALLDAVFARASDARAPVYLWYSIRLEQLLLAILGIACVSTITPRLSKAIKTGEEGVAQSLFSLSYRRIFSLMIPATCGLFLLGALAVQFLYGHGHFSSEAVLETTYCLWAYGCGLLPATLTLLFSAVFFARGDFRTPMLVSVAMVALSVLFNVFFVFGLHLGAISAALSTSLCAWINSWVLYRIGILGRWRLPLNFSKMAHLIVVACLALFSSGFVDFLWFDTPLFSVWMGEIPSFSGGISGQALQLSIAGASFLLTLLGLGLLSRNEELKDLVTLFFSKRERSSNAIREK